MLRSLILKRKKGRQNQERPLENHMNGGEFRFDVVWLHGEGEGAYKLIINVGGNVGLTSGKKQRWRNNAEGGSRQCFKGKL